MSVEALPDTGKHRRHGDGRQAREEDDGNGGQPRDYVAHTQRDSTPFSIASTSPPNVSRLWRVVGDIAHARPLLPMMSPDTTVA